MGSGVLMIVPPVRERRRVIHGVVAPGEQRLSLKY